MKVSQLVDRVFKGEPLKTIKYRGCLYYPDRENKTFINIYGVTLWSVLISEVESGIPINNIDVEEVC